MPLPAVNTQEHETLIGSQKVAIVILALGASIGAEIYKLLSEEEIQHVTQQIALLKNIPSVTIRRVMEEFHTMIKAQEYITNGGIEYSREILEASVGEQKAKDILRDVEMSMQVKGFNVLQEVDPNQLMAFLQKEHPQTVALVLTQLNPLQAATVLIDLPQPVQVDVTHRLSKMERVFPETIKAVERVLESRIDFSQGSHQLGGVKSAADILNLVGQRHEKNIMNGLAKEDPELATEIKNLMFVFEDVIALDDRSVQKVLKEVDNKDLAFALKAVSEELKGKILSNMSKRASDIVLEELKFMGPVRLREVEEAQQKIIEIIRRLEEEGQIVLGSAQDQLI
ncbi:flagellar motor switch protein FliG [candidate division LCP-89 bacterium B3_LCP]|uniref:Flagellar motor switch protein FliG n=1 Tax=candidate division LCP-89 bacterium B3_LCP TaxID=2012998 RepID=A0A532V4U7_UNCL8|nr:MAG: flagellar motor switch protein FliG [candidate division LCP-89 bacterium B3_LCP]